MNLTIALLLALTFVVSIVGLLVLVWAVSNDQFGLGPTAAKLIFAKGEIGVTEDSAAAPSDRQALQATRREAL